MKLILSLLAAVALAACASDKEAYSGSDQTLPATETQAPKAHTVSLVVEGMT